MAEIYLKDFTGKDDLERFSAALSYMKDNPGTTLYVEPGVYNITTERARNAQASVMKGEWGRNAQNVMFTPTYRYDRILDFKGHKDSTVIAYGATLMVDGFMEGISIRHCENVTVKGFTIDHVRKPYTKGILRNIRQEEGSLIADAELTDWIYMETPVIRTTVYSQTAGRFINEKVRFNNWTITSSRSFEIKFTGDSEIAEGDEIYFGHVFHTRPGVLVYKAENTVIEDVTIHSWPGMGVTAQSSRDILLKGVQVVPSAGEHFSTNTDATHFAVCRGKLRVEGCMFEGQGDDSINVHSYYYTPVAQNDRTITLIIEAPDGTHAQGLVYPEPGDRFEMNDDQSLEILDTFYVVRSEPDPAGKCCHVTLDRDIPDDVSVYLFSDPDEVPEVEFVNCHTSNHHARSLLMKSRKCLIENCLIENVFQDGIKISAEKAWKEGINSEDVTVRRCRIRGCGRMSPNGCGGISVYMDTDIGKPVHGKVVIEDCIIECPDVSHGIVLRDVKEAEVRRCKIVSKDEPVIVGDGVKAVIE